MERGLAARLSPNEEITLLHVQGAAALSDLNPRDVARLKLLELVSVDADAIALTLLGKRRIALFGRRPSDPKADEDRLPPEREAAQKRREAEFLALLGRPAEFFARLDSTAQRPSITPKAGPKRT